MTVFNLKAFHSSGEICLSLIILINGVLLTELLLGSLLCLFGTAGVDFFGKFY